LARDEAAHPVAADGAIKSEREALRQLVRNLCRGFPGVARPADRGGRLGVVFRSQRDGVEILDGNASPVSSTSLVIAHVPLALRPDGSFRPAAPRRPTTYYALPTTTLTRASPIGCDTVGSPGPVGRPRTPRLRRGNRPVFHNSSTARNSPRLRPGFRRNAAGPEGTTRRREGSHGPVQKSTGFRTPRLHLRRTGALRRGVR